jgi:hypothetical protein
MKTLLFALVVFSSSFAAAVEVTQGPCVDIANAALTSLKLPKVGETPKPVGKRFNIKRTGETLARPEISDGIELTSPASFTAMITTEPQGVSGWVINIERKQSEDVRIHRMKTRLTFAVNERGGTSLCRFTRAEFAHFKKPTDKEVWVRKTVRCLKPNSKPSKYESELDTSWVQQDCLTATTHNS